MSTPKAELKFRNFEFDFDRVNYSKLNCYFGGRFCHLIYVIWLRISSFKKCDIFVQSC